MTRQLIHRHVSYACHQIDNRVPDIKPSSEHTKMVNLVNLLTFERTGTIPLTSRIFSERIRRDLMHSDVIRFLASLRKGLAVTKTRGEVRGSGRKIHPQKGTGKARAGSSRAPHRRKGGRCFGPKRRSFLLKLPRKVTLFARRSALSSRYATGNTHFFDEKLDNLNITKTKMVSNSLLKRFDTLKLLIIHTDILPKSFIAACNALSPRVKCLNIQKNSIETYDILLHDELFISSSAIKHLENQLITE